MKSVLFSLALLVVPALHAAERARNVILFLGDAGGVSTLHAASVHGHNQPQALFIQQLPHIALMDTSAIDRWVTDSAAGMSAIMTGQKTANGVISQGPGKDKAEGEPLQTVLEYAEQRGLSTGVISNMSMADATPAACYAHASSRKKTGEIFAQVATPRFGDGVDLVIGAGRKPIYASTKELGMDLDGMLRAKGYTVLEGPEALTSDMKRVVALTDNADFDPVPVVARAIEILNRNPKGYFLMVEWDMHTPKVKRGLDRVLKMDEVVRQTAAQVKDDTLIVFTADHSYDLRVRGGKKGEPLLVGDEAAPPKVAGSVSAALANAGVRVQNSFTGEEERETKKADGAAKGGQSTRAVSVRVEDGHTGEQVLVAAKGPGAERVRGFIVNTDMFGILLSAYGWQPNAKGAQ